MDRCDETDYNDIITHHVVLMYNAGSSHFSFSMVSKTVNGCFSPFIYSFSRFFTIPSTL